MNLKSLLIILGFATYTISPSVLAASPVKPAQQTTESVVLDVQNMTCSLWKITIRKALEAVDGVQNVKVDFKNKTASITFDPKKTDTGALIKATTNVGYPASLHTSSQ